MSAVERPGAAIANAHTTRPPVVAALTCFNRRDKTLAALQALADAFDAAGLPAAAVLVDDGSRDGTAEAVRAQHPWVQIDIGPGDLYWTRGMHRALASAQAQASEHVLWLNDDTVLQPQALCRLLREAATLQQQHGRAVILVGSTHDGSGQRSYGGAVAASRWRRFSYRPVGSPDQPLRCEAINGNCVLVPISAAQQLGNLDPAFEHAMGDTDYALRAVAAGHPIYVASGFVGRCDLNAVAGSFNDRSLPLARRWRDMRSRKGLPWRSWWHFTRRHGGVLAPLYFVWPYARLIASALWRKAISTATASPARH